MNNRKPVTTKINPSKRAVLSSKNKEKKTWNFSFKYFKQIENFGLGDTNSKWFVSLLEKLRDLCNDDFENFEKDHKLKNDNRYHEIDWNNKNIPIQRHELIWINKEIIENSEDYKFYQFQISKSLGRVIGFWKEDYSTYYIVFLDTKHNMQPSKYNNYKITDTTILNSEYTLLFNDLEMIKHIECLNNDCKVKNKLDLIPTKHNNNKIICFQLEDDFYQLFTEVVKNKSIKEIIENGILKLI